MKTDTIPVTCRNTDTAAGKSAAAARVRRGRPRVLRREIARGASNLAAEY